MTARHAAVGAGLAIRLVTEDQALTAAKAKTLGLALGKLWLDGDFCSPGTRRAATAGIEALAAECTLAARRAGVDGAVLGSLQASDSGFDRERRAACDLDRMMAHEERRAAEMREAPATPREIGLPERMARAAAEWQDRIGSLGLDGAKPHNRADRIFARLG